MAVLFFHIEVESDFAYFLRLFMKLNGSCSTFMEIHNENEIKTKHSWLWRCGSAMCVARSSMKFARKNT